MIGAPVYQNNDLTRLPIGADEADAQIDGELLRHMIRSNAKITFKFRSDAAVMSRWRGKKMPLRRLKGNINQQAAAMRRLLKRMKKKAAAAQAVFLSNPVMMGAPRLIRTPEEHAVHFVHSITGYEKARIKECLGKTFDANQAVFRLAAAGIFDWIQVKRGDSVSPRYRAVRKEPAND